MKQLLLLLILFSSLPFYCQDLSGTWRWVSPSNENTFELQLEQNGSRMLRGRHCAVFFNGIKTDCTTEGNSSFSINLIMLRKNIFGGTIESGYSASSGKMKLVYDNTEDVLSFSLTRKPNKEFYLPKEAVLRRIE